MRVSSRTIVFLFCVYAVIVASPAFGQGDWTANLIFNPFPSPYINDWENNPSIGQAVLTNGTSATVSVRVYLTIIHETRGMIASANSRTFDFPPGSSSALTTRDLIDDQSVEYNHDIREVAERTGRLPEGKYHVCLRLENESGTVLLDNQCAEFTIVYPDPPYLVYPSDGESIVTGMPMFQWTPVQVPVGYSVHYAVRIAEILTGQAPAQALGANYPQFENTDLTGTSVQYPADALPLQKGKSYVWQVQVLDDKGYPPSSNNGRSEFWTFVCDVDTTHPVDHRQLAGHVYDAVSGQALKAARVVYRPVQRRVSGADTSWIAEADSIECSTDEFGRFHFDSALNKSYFSIEGNKAEYATVQLIGKDQYQNGDIKDFKIHLALAPPGHRRLAGVLKDFYSNQPVLGATITYHVVNAIIVADSTGPGHINLVEDSQKKLETISDASGRFEFSQAADSSFFSLRAAKSPSYLPAVDIGPDQRQDGDIDDYVFLIKPNAGNVTGTIATVIGGKTQPVSKAIVRLTRSAVVSVQTTFLGITTSRTKVYVQQSDVSAYSDANGFFKIQRVSQEKPVVVETGYVNMWWAKLPVKSVTTYQSYSYRVSVDDPRYRPYLSADSLVLSPGETTETGEHLLMPKSGTIAGRITCGTRPIADATVSLYQPVHQSQSTRSSVQATAVDTGHAVEAVPSENVLDTTWGNTTTQKPSGESLDVVTTDQNGLYVFAAVPINDPAQVTERYTVWVEADGYNPATKGDRIGAENEVDSVHVNLSRLGGVVFGRVAEADGSDLAGVRVELQQIDTLVTDSLATKPSPVWMETGGDGSYSLGNINPGLYRLSFEKSGFTPLVTDTFRVDYGDKIRYDETLAAAKGLIALTVTDKDKKGLTDVCVKSADIPSLIGFTDDTGRLVISDAVAGNVKLQLRKVGYADLDTTVLVRANDTLALKVTLRKCVGQIIVRVVEKGGNNKRLEDFTVKLGKAESSTPFSGKTDSTKGVTTLKTDFNGEAYFAEAPVGQQDLLVKPPDDSTYKSDYVVVETKVIITEGLNTQPVIVEMEAAARMKGTIKNKDGGTPLAGVVVSVEGNTKVSAKSDSSGVFTLRNVPTAEAVTLIARKGGFRSSRYKHDSKLAAGEQATGISIELEKSPMDSLFGFPIALDSATTGSNGRNRVFGTLTDVPATFGAVLKGDPSSMAFADVEVDSAYKPTSDTVKLSQTQVDINMFGLDATMSYTGGLRLEWIDSVKAGRITGDVTIKDPISKIFPETKFLDLKIPKSSAPSFWAGGVNRGLSRYGLTATATEVQVQIKSVKVGIDFMKSNVDTAGLHMFGTVYLGKTLIIGFDNLNIGKNASGDISLKAITFKTKPAIKIPLYAFTLIDSTLTWEATGFRASGSILLDKLKPAREFGFKDLRISPEGEFLSLTLTADAKNGTITVHGQKFQIEKLEFGTENFASQTAEHVKYFAFGGKMTLSALEKPVGISLKYTEKDIFTGSLNANQSVTFAKIVTISLDSIVIGNDSTKGQFVGFSGGVKFGAVKGLSLQANNLRIYFDGAISVDEMGLVFIAGPAEVEIKVRYADGIFDGKGLLSVKPAFSLGAEFRYGGANDWWVRIVSGTRIPIGPAEIVQLSGGVGRKDDVWKFSFGGIVAPAKADKGIRLDVLVEVQKTPQGVIILGNAGVEVASGTQIGKATIEINMPERRVCGSIVFGMDFKAITASAQLDLKVQFGEYWYVYGRANIDVLKFFKNNGVIIVANNWNWQHDGKTQLMSGIYVELNSTFNVNANWYVIKWGVNFDRHAMVYIGWNGDFAGSIDMSGGAYANIGFGPFDLIQARASMALNAHLSYIEPEWTAGARGHFNLEGTIGWCDNARCWSICWRCFWRIFGHCVFALPTGAKGCVGMDAYIEYSTSKGMKYDVSF